MSVTKHFGRTAILPSKLSRVVVDLFSHSGNTLTEMDWRLLGVRQCQQLSTPVWDHKATDVQQHKDNTVTAELLFERELSKVEEQTEH